VLLALLAGGFALLIALPWRTRIHAERVARTERQLRVFAPVLARVQNIYRVGEAKADAYVKQDDVPRL
jgi:putative peptide zinc metalloprotease protein